MGLRLALVFSLLSDGCFAVLPETTHSERVVSDRVVTVAGQGGWNPVLSASARWNAVDVVAVNKLLCTEQHIQTVADHIHHSATIDGWLGPGDLLRGCGPDWLCIFLFAVGLAVSLAVLVVSAIVTGIIELFSSDETITSERTTSFQRDCSTPIANAPIHMSVWGLEMIRTTDAAGKVSFAIEAPPNGAPGRAYLEEQPQIAIDFAYGAAPPPPPPTPRPRKPGPPCEYVQVMSAWRCPAPLICRRGECVPDSTPP